MSRCTHRRDSSSAMSGEQHAVWRQTPRGTRIRLSSLRGYNRVRLRDTQLLPKATMNGRCRLTDCGTAECAERALLNVSDRHNPTPSTSTFVDAAREACVNQALLGQSLDVNALRDVSRC